MSKTSCALWAMALSYGLGACGPAPEDDPAPVGALVVDAGPAAGASELRVRRAAVGADGWLAVWHVVGDASTLAGSVFLTAGEHADLVVPLAPPASSEAGAAVRVSLHVDAPADGRFTATDVRVDGDDPVMANAAGTPIVGMLPVTAAPDEPNALVIADQTITVKPPKLTVTASIATVPAYVVIRDGSGAVIGSERIWDKGPRDYPVSLELPRSWTAVPLTGALYAADGNAPDLATPIRNLAGDPVVASFAVTLPPANTLVVGDQTLTSFGYKIKVDEIAVDELPAWVAVYEDDAGAPGALLGQAPILTSPKVALGVDLTRFVLPHETLWVVLHADVAPLGALTEADPPLLGADRQPLRVAIAVTNGSCDGLKTKRCDAAEPNAISWLDRCDQPASTTTPCADGAVCDDSGPYVKCTPLPDPCAGDAGTVCVADDPHATYFEDRCGIPTRVAARCGATSLCKEGAGGATCSLAPSCAGNATRECDPSDATKIRWLDRCGQPNGNTIACGATSSCDDSGLDPTCTVDVGCGGNTTLACDDADPANLYWLDGCGEKTGATVPCGAGFVCDEVDGEATCVDPEPCSGPAQKFCDPADRSAIKWLDGCGRVKASTIPCGAGHECQDDSGEASCVSTDVCGGNTRTVCVADDPGHVYWVDACGALTGSTYPCGVATCDDRGGDAKCSVIGTCADTKLRVCDPDDATVVMLTNACGDDLGVFSTCQNGKRCDEATPGEASCACVPTDDVTCFGRHFLYEPSGIRKVDSCGNPSGPVVTTCKNGEICYDAVGEPVCTTSLSDTASPMIHRGCSFIDYVTYKTDLEVECRCRRHDPTPDDIHVYNDGGNMACASQADSWARGWTAGSGPHFRHMLHSFNGGGAYSPSHHELFATKHFTDPTYQGAGMVVGYDIRTGARRIVSGRYPKVDGGYEMYGSGFESQRAVGEQRFEATTFPGAWDLELGGDGNLYVWGSRGGNQEITRVHPDTGLRTLVWRQALEGDLAAPAHGQCYSTRAKTTYYGGFIPVELESHAFALGPDGSFYLGFRNEGSEGNGIARIAANGSTCTVVSRWNGSMGEVGGGASPQYSNLEGFVVHAGKLYATLQIGKRLLAIDLANGSRALIANPAGSVDSTPGQSTMFWDATRDLLITAGSVQPYLAVAVDVTSGERQALFLTAPDAMIPSAPPWETGAHGAIDNGNYMGYGAVALDPDDNDHVYMVIKWGLLKYEMSTGNSYVMSQ
ncbi:MAG: hypothetical protein U1F43_21085 [Myxococcota bacterium]